MALAQRTRGSDDAMVQTLSATVPALRYRDTLRVRKRRFFDGCRVMVAETAAKRRNNSERHFIKRAELQCESQAGCYQLRRPSALNETVAQLVEEW
jgi:hypothetical protein